MFNQVGAFPTIYVCSELCDIPMQEALRKKFVIFARHLHVLKGKNNESDCISTELLMPTFSLDPELVIQLQNILKNNEKICNRCSRTQKCKVL
jgi:hypothetical protein